jgi:nitroreductase
MLRKPAPADHSIHPLLRERWSPRAFDVRLPTQDQLLTLFEAARWSPSAGNGQPWSFIVVTHDDQECFGEAVGMLSEGNRVWARIAPLLIVTVAQLIRENGTANRTALYDLGQAVAHLSVQAGALGLALRQMGGFSQDRARELFSIPAGYEPVTVLALGQQGDHHTVLPEALREREQAPRERKPLASFVFSGQWGQPAPLVELAREVGG